jgi:hypothetical protein
MATNENVRTSGANFPTLMFGTILIVGLPAAIVASRLIVG